MEYLPVLMIYTWVCLAANYPISALLWGWLVVPWLAILGTLGYWLESFVRKLTSKLQFGEVSKLWYICLIPCLVTNWLVSLVTFLITTIAETSVWFEDRLYDGTLLSYLLRGPYHDD